MKIEVIPTAQQVNSNAVKGKTVVVIDVLRATSVMITALNNSAKGVVPVLSPEDAFDIKEKSHDEVILGGERHAEPIAGFDYGNSPLSYSSSVIKDKVLVMTTTNGTLAIKNALSARELLVASFINDEAVANMLANKDEIALVCSGNNGLYTLEDALCAGRIMHLLEQRSSVELSDFALSTKVLYQARQHNVSGIASKGFHYGVLLQKGYQADLEYCFTQNVSNTVPYWDGKWLVSK